MYREYGYINDRSRKLLEKSIEKMKDVDEIAVSMYEEGFSSTEISKKLGICREEMCFRLLYKHGIRFENNKSVDIKYFQSINHESAYWLGYIQGDGSISSEGIFEISSKEKCHIELFKECIKSKHKIGKKIVNGEEYWRLGIAREDFVSTLEDLGILRNKSYKNTKFKLVSDEYIYSYLLGFFDADGSVQSHTGKTINIRFTISKYNERFVREFSDFLRSININPKIYQSGERAFEICLNRPDSKKIANLMYENSKIYLERKYNICKCVLPT